MNHEIHGPMRGGGAATAGRAGGLIAAAALLFAAASAWGGGWPETTPKPPVASAEGPAGEPLTITLSKDSEFKNEQITVVVAETEASAGRLYRIEDLGVEVTDEMQSQTYRIVANLQVYQKAESGEFVELGDFLTATGGPLTVIIPYPAKLEADPPVLYFWVGKPGSKGWVALHREELDKNSVVVPRYGVDRKNGVLVLEVDSWPADDIIISWDG